MNRLFEHSRSFWVKYSDYVIKEAPNGEKYLQAAPTAKPEPYDPIDDFENIALDAVNVGRLCINKDTTEREKQEAIRGFAIKYGMRGIMTAIPTTPQFLSYENVFFPKNQFIRGESMPVLQYMDEFFPFEKLDFIKNGEEYSWSIEGDNETVALGFLSDGRPVETHMSFQREYAERLDWMELQFKDWGFTLLSTFLFYEDFDRRTDRQKSFYRQSMEAYEGMTPTYHVALMDDRPRLVWNFNSLIQGIQLMFSMMLTDEKRPVKMCVNCGKAFIAKDPSARICRPGCKRK